ETDDGRGHDIGREEERARHAREGPALMDVEGKGEGDDRDAGNDDQPVQQRVLEGDDGEFVFERIDEIFKAYPARLAEDSPFGKRDIGAEENRRDVEQQKRHREEGDEDIADAVRLLPLTLAGADGQ